MCCQGHTTILIQSLVKAARPSLNWFNVRAGKKKKRFIVRNFVKTFFKLANIFFLTLNEDSLVQGRGKQHKHKKTRSRPEGSLDKHKGEAKPKETQKGLEEIITSWRVEGWKLKGFTKDHR